MNMRLADKIIRLFFSGPWNLSGFIHPLSGLEPLSGYKSEAFLFLSRESIFLDEHR